MKKIILIIIISLFLVTEVRAEKDDVFDDAFVNECSSLFNIKTANHSPSYVIGFFGGVEERENKINGNFSVLAEKIIKGDRFYKVSKTANYSSIANALHNYILAHPEPAVLFKLKSLITLVNVDEDANSEIKNFAGDRSISDFVSGFIVANWGSAGGYEDTLHFVGVMINILFSGSSEILARLEQMGTVKVDYYPILKQNLIIALSNNDFESVTSILENDHVDNLSKRYAILCITKGAK